jgi:putative tryptophan/tyrosine transport system substrate-binding protein
MDSNRMKRRDFIATFAGSAVAWPLAVSAQVRPVPVIGFLGFESIDPKLLARFSHGLSEWGYFDGRNVAFEYRWAREQDQELPALAVDLVRHQVALIVATGGLVSAKAAREATATIPILFTTVLDPVENGFLASFNRPGGNATGLSLSTAELLPKRRELLQQLVPAAEKIALLMNDDDTGFGATEKAQIEAHKLVPAKLGLTAYFARSERDIEAAFVAMVRQNTDAVLINSDPLFGHQRAQIVALAARYALPACYARREFVEASGLMSYGPSATERWRQIGEYAGRILKGARPWDLPVRLHDQYELVINIKTAKALGLTVPPLLHAIADDSIE